MMLDLLLRLLLATGIEQQTYLLHGPTPLNFTAYGGAELVRYFPADDGAGGWRSTLTIHLPCNSGVTVDTIPIRRHCMYLPWIATGD